VAEFKPFIRVVCPLAIRLGYNLRILVQRFPMSAHNDPHTSDDPVENVVKHIPVIIPAAGAVLIFLLAFIAVFMA
jgi:hypothetical protein